MAFERMMDGEDDLQKQLERQLGGQAAPQVPGQDWQTYADKGTAPASVASGGVSPATTFGQNANGSQATTQDRQNFPNGPAAPGAGAPGMPAAPTPSPSAAPKTGGPGGLAQYGTGDIEAAKGLKMGDYASQLEGFSGVSRRAAGERGGNTIKNSAGDIFSRYDVTQPGAVDRVMADQDFRSLHPNAVKVDHPNGDLIDFDGPGPDRPVDVIRGAKPGGSGEAWQWGADDGTGGGGGGGGQPMGGMDINSLIAGIGGGADPMAAIQAQIAAASNGQDEQTLIQQLLAQQGI